MKLSIGISPCPNDTYIFEAIHNETIGIEGISFDFHFADIQELNRMASAGSLDLVKLSYAHYFSVATEYALLRAGGAMGKGVGPLLIYKNKPEELSKAVCAIPGENTTANFLLNNHYPEISQKQTFRFDQIEDAVLNEEVALGLIIHENRFTYEKKGLHKLADLGDLWEASTNCPIPLGGIAIKRKFSKSLANNINELIIQSIELSGYHLELSEFICQHAQEMKTEVMQQHIDLYVNEHSIEVGKAGILAIEKMQAFIAPHQKYDIFIAK